MNARNAPRSVRESAGAGEGLAYNMGMDNIDGNIHINDDPRDSLEYLESLPPRERALAEHYLTKFLPFQLKEISLSLERLCNAMRRPGRPGPKPRYTRDQQRQLVMGWDQARLCGLTLDEYLEERGGYDGDGNLAISRATFYRWKKNHKNCGRRLPPSGGRGSPRSFLKIELVSILEVSECLC